MKLNLFLLALRGLTRRPFRTLSTGMGLAIMAASLFLLTMLFGAVESGVERGSGRLGAEAVALPRGASEEEVRDYLISGSSRPLYMNNEIVRKLRERREVLRASPQLFMVSEPLACCTVSDTTLVGYDPDTDFTITPWLKESDRDPRGGKAPAAEDARRIVVGSSIEAGTGGRMIFYGLEFTVAGKLEPTGLRSLDGSVFIPIEGAREMIAGSAERALKPLGIEQSEISAVMLEFREGVDAERAAVEIELAYPEVEVVVTSRVMSRARNSFLVPLKSLSFITGGLWLVVLMLAGLLHALVLGERRWELGVMLALGGAGGRVRRLLMLEALLLSTAASAAGVALGAAAFKVTAGSAALLFSVPFLLPGAREAVPLAGGVFLFVVLAGFVVFQLPLLYVLRDEEALMTGPTQSLGSHRYL